MRQFAELSVVGESACGFVDKKGPLFRPLKNNLTKILEKPLDTDAVYKLLKGLPEPRMDRTRRHKLVDILVIGLCSQLTGGEGFTDMEVLGEAKLDWLKEFLESGPPSLRSEGNGKSRGFPVSPHEQFPIAAHPQTPSYGLAARATRITCSHSPEFTVRAAQYSFAYSYEICSY